MFLRILALMIIIPILEIYLLLKLGNIIGVFSTILLIIFTGVVGLWLAKTQGFMVISQFQNSIITGYMPGDSILEGMSVLIGAILLLTPGLITDTIGFLLLIPYTRKFILQIIKKRLRYYFENGSFKIFIR